MHKLNFFIFLSILLNISFSAQASSCSKIGLLNPHNRTVVHCYNGNSLSAEDCARDFEKKGFVRFRDIPYKTANFDFLKVDTYPTRRWRNSEITPRW